jgi:hypothetical protein
MALECNRPSTLPPAVFPELVPKAGIRARKLVNDQMYRLPMIAHSGI